MNLKDNKWKIRGAALVALLISSWLLWDHYKAAPNTMQGNWSHPQAAASIPEVVKPGPKRVVTLDKKVASKKLELPTGVTEDPQVDVLQTAEITTKNAKIQTVAYMNMSTGRTTLISKELPKPFLRFENVKEIGIRGGYDFGLKPQVDVHGRFQFLGIGPAKLGVYGETNALTKAVDPSAKIYGKAMLDLSSEF